MTPEDRLRAAEAEIERRSRVMAESGRFTPWGRRGHELSPGGNGPLMAENYNSEIDLVARRHQSLQLMVTAVREAVEAAREAGAPWSAISEVMDVPEQDLIILFPEHPRADE